jgi:hypothetical protein
VYGNVQVVNGGSNLTYGIRTLYARHFESFDKWLAGDVSALYKSETEAPKSQIAVGNPDAEAEEAAAILESLGGQPLAPRPEAQLEPKPAASKKRKASEKKDASKVCSLGLKCGRLVVLHRSEVHSCCCCRNASPAASPRRFKQYRASMAPESQQTSILSCVRFVQQDTVKTRSSYVTAVTKAFTYSVSPRPLMMCQRGTGSARFATRGTVTTSSSRQATP